jgi:hypothetical protein
MLAKLFGSRLRGKLIGWMFTHTDERFYVRQLQSLLQEDATNLSRELSRLATLGLLTRTAEGKQKYYQANAESPVFSELHGLAIKTVGVADVLRSALEAISGRIRVAFIYTARSRV